jgi:phosphopentomutase
MLGFPNSPILSPARAGSLLGELAGLYDFSVFEYWSTDYAGHKQDMHWAVEQLQTFDTVLRGLMSAAADDLLLLVTSDHGNMEDLATRRHTAAAVPALLIGPSSARRAFARGLTDLTGIAPAILRLLMTSI